MLVTLRFTMSPPSRRVRATAERGKATSFSFGATVGLWRIRVGAD